MLIDFSYNQGRFWGFWQGIGCLLLVIGLVGLVGRVDGFSLANGDTVVAATEGALIDYSPNKASLTPYYSGTNLDIWSTQPAGTVCNFFYKTYKATQWLPITTNNCSATLTKPMRSNNLVIDIKLVVSGVNLVTVTDSYVFGSR
jgi:hypothetical protein